MFGLNSGMMGRRSNRDYVAVGHFVAPYMTVYEWADGFGAKIADPSVVPSLGAGGYSNDVVFSDNNRAVGLAYVTTVNQSIPVGAVYPFAAGAFGAPRYALSRVNGGLGVTFSNASNSVVFAETQGSAAYSWDDTNLTLINQLVGTYHRKAVFAGGGTRLIICEDTAPQLQARVYSNSTGIGAAFSIPSEQPTSLTFTANLRPQEDAIVVGQLSSPFIGAYAWSNSTGFGARFANPTVLPAGPSAPVFSKSGAAVILSQVNSPFVAAYAWSSSSGFGVRYANPTVLPAGTSGNRVAVSPDNRYVAMVAGNSSLVEAYQWGDALGWGAKLANPSVAPVGNAVSVAFSN